jgi:hypothetical protein
MRSRGVSSLVPVGVALVMVALAHLSGGVTRAQDAGAGDGAADDGGVARERAVADGLMDCRAVDCFQRGSCNRRVLAALGQIKTTAAELPGFQSAAVSHRHIQAQIERQERLRTYIAPECGAPASACDLLLPLGLSDACRTLGRRLEDAQARARPALGPSWQLNPSTPPIRLDDDGTQRLVGRWDGWIVRDDNSASRFWLRVNRVSYVNYSDGAVKVCSDQGMVLARVRNGMLAIPRREPLDFGGWILLWRSPPHYDDLDGVLLLDGEPGRHMQAGLVWLSRSLTPAQAASPTDYPCQDEELLLRRKHIWFQDP